MFGARSVVVSSSAARIGHQDGARVCERCLNRLGNVGSAHAGVAPLIESVIFPIGVEIFGAVAMSNVHWQWTHNPCAAGLIGIGVAFSFTVVVTRLLDALRSVAR